VVRKLEQQAYPQYDEAEEDVLPLREILHIVLRRIWIIVLAMIVATGLALGFSLAQTPTYKASVKILVGQREDVGHVASLSGDVEGLQQLTKTLTAAVDSRPVAEAVIKRLNLETTPEALLDNLQAQQVPETQFIQVSYEDPSAERAQLVAETTGEAFSDLISTVSPKAYAVTATIWEPAQVSEEPVSPNLKLNVFLGLVLGVVLGLALAFLSESLGVRNAREERGPETNRAMRPRPVK
jgi:succinoglycan biosynthesis transport protein ExoP